MFSSEKNPVQEGVHILHTWVRIHMITSFLQHKGNNTWSDKSMTCDKESILRLEQPLDIRRYVIGT
jgi:hypothetical protein